MSCRPGAGFLISLSTGHKATAGRTASTSSTSSPPNNYYKIILVIYLSS